ncbi:hypothetical protein D3C76_1580720 [compost metagenome]
MLASTFVAFMFTGGLELKLRKLILPSSIRTSFRVIGRSFPSWARQSVPSPVWEVFLLAPSTKFTSGLMNCTSATTAWSYQRECQLTERSISGALTKGTGTLPSTLTIFRPLIL